MLSVKYRGGPEDFVTIGNKTFNAASAPTSTHKLLLKYHFVFNDVKLFYSAKFTQFGTCISASTKPGLNKVSIWTEPGPKQV